MKSILSVFGTRPEAIKMAPVIKELELRKNFESITCVTAQHREMLDEVLEVFKIKPKYDLNIMEEKQNLSSITSKILLGIEQIIQQEQPDLVLVHGDTTTAMAASLAAFYQQKKIGHIEAGLRTFDKDSPFPEEINRQIIDRVSDLLFSPTSLTAKNLQSNANENQKIFITGNTVIDALKTTISKNYHHSALDWANGSRIILLTSHRRENIGKPMKRIFTAINQITAAFSDVKVIYPVHPNPTVKQLAQRAFGNNPRVKLIKPLNVIDFHNFIQRSYFVISDSGGVQEEAPSLGKPVLVIRENTERPEGIEAGVLKLVGTQTRNIYQEAEKLLIDKTAYEAMAQRSNPYGDGSASRKIVRAIEASL